MTYIPVKLRSFVIERAQHSCEYCLIHQDDIEISHECDHIDAEKHGGKTIEENLCYCCAACNRSKGSDIASLDPLTGERVFLFHPRLDEWDDHFRILSTGRIETITMKGRATAYLLDFNIRERILHRRLLIELGRYPKVSNE
jgi:hypothetical protein